MPNVVGKRYMCRVCGSEFIVTKGGDGCLVCHGEPMQLKDTGQSSTPQAKREGDR